MGRLVECSSCRLHILPHEPACPHCGAEVRTTTAALTPIILLGLALTGCPGGDDGDTGAGSESSTVSSPTGTDPSSSGVATSATTDDSLTGSGGVEYGSADTFDDTVDPTFTTGADDSTSSSGSDSGSSSESSGTGESTGDSTGSNAESVGEPEYGVPETG